MELSAPECVYIGMDNLVKAETKEATVLKPGQRWKTDHGCILIMGQGERVVSYRKLRNPEQRTALTNLIRPEALLCYLHQVGAVLEN